MGSDQEFVDFVVDCLNGLHGVRYRKIFGEYALYYANKVVALICDNQLFVKPTEPGIAHFEDPIWAPPYPGAKDYLLVDELADNPSALSALIQMTAEALPEPKLKKKSAKKESSPKKSSHKQSSKKSG